MMGWGTGGGWGFGEMDMAIFHMGDASGLHSRAAHVWDWDIVVDGV